jgi:MoxR-like ATPase
MARALALVLGRDYVVAEDIELLFPSVVMHRMLMATDVVMEGVTGNELAARVWQACAQAAPRPEPTWDAATAAADA